MRYGGSSRGRRNGVSPIGQVVGGHLAGMQIEAKIREHTAPLVWAEVVGPQVASATEVLGVSGGVLRVSTKSSVWSHELTFYKVDILKRLNTRLGARADSPAITDIHFQNHGLRRNETRNQKPDQTPLAPNPNELDDVALSPSELALIERAIATISDEQLRATMRRVRIADLKMRTWRLDNGWVPCAGCGDLVPAQHLSQDAVPEDPLSVCPRCRIARNRRR